MRLITMLTIKLYSKKRHKAVQLSSILQKKQNKTFGKFNRTKDAEMQRKVGVVIAFPQFIKFNII